ncbi:MAG: DUF1830 domain-containing protein [Leptolyngbyaceae cyanobacterium]
MNPTPFVYLYHNNTSTIQIIRVEQTPHGCIERTVLPQQRIWFEAIPESYLEVQSAVFSSIVSPERIPCKQLQIPVYDACPIAA